MPVEIPIAGEVAMADEMDLTNRSVYEARNHSGNIPGMLAPKDWSRFQQTLKFVPRDAHSILDCGCDRGHWLNYVLQRRSLEKHLGLDISEGRIAEAKSLYPDLNVRVEYLEKSEENEAAFDVVTALEVIEHIPGWEEVLSSLLTWARKRVIVTVPYRQKIAEHICIHCGKPTPAGGHLHSFSEETFPEYSGWTRSYAYIKNYGVGGATLRHRISRRIWPRIVWLLVAYDRKDFV